MSRKIGAVCIVLGAILLAGALVLLCYNNWESRSAMTASAEILRQIQDARQEDDADTLAQDDHKAPTEGIGGNPDDISAVVGAETIKEMTVVEIDGYGYIGYLSIPVLELELPVMSEWDYQRLRVAPCRQFGSTNTDDIVIAAHNYAFHFGQLSQLVSGDLITFTDMDGTTILYEVRAVDILQPTQVETVKNSGFDMVLYTCTYGGKTRVTIFCDRVT